MAEFYVSGVGAGDYLDWALAGRISTLPIGKAKYSLVLDEGGGIIDDVIVYRLQEDLFLVIANAGNREAVATALDDRAVDRDVRVVDATDDYSLVAVQGPAARAVLDATPGLGAFAHPLDDLKYYASVSAAFEGQPMLIARTGYTGEDGYELLIPNEKVTALWDALLAAGAPHGLVPAGLAARDTLRLEAGMPLYGHELSLDMVPGQAGLGRVVAIDKPDFVGRAGLAAVVASDAPVLVGPRLGRQARRPRRLCGLRPFDGRGCRGRDHQRRPQPDPRSSDRDGIRLAVGERAGHRARHRRARHPHPRDRHLPAVLSTRQVTDIQPSHAATHRRNK